MFCAGFVLYKGHECFAKFLGTPQTSHVSIEQAYKHDYPAITICYGNSFEKQQIYDNTLAKCNLTHDQYFIWNIWVGNGTEDFCSDPAKLYDKMTGERQTIIDMIQLTSFGQNIVGKDEYFQLVDVWTGRCFSFKMIPDTPMTQWNGWFHEDAKIYVHMPGNFFGSADSKLEIDMKRFLNVNAKVEYEIFEALDFDGKPCKNYFNGRDDCIHDAIYKESMDTINCTSPASKNKSNICTKTTNAKKAYVLYDILIHNMTEANRRCPKSCTNMMLSFGTFKESEEGYGLLGLSFKEFIKVSRSQWSYGGLELLAEVGGYVGLFLGVSINQISTMFKTLVVTLHRRLN